MYTVFSKGLIVILYQLCYNHFSKLGADMGVCCMECPCCDNEMTKGIVQSARQIFFTTKAHGNWFIPDTVCGKEIVLSSHNWTRPTCTAYHCVECKKVVIDYSVEVG